MSRRWGNGMNGERFLGNTNEKEVHDLDNEKAGTNQCQIDEIMRAGHAKAFATLQAAKPTYDNCAYCLGSSAR